MVVDVAKELLLLKRAVITRFDKELLLLQKGYPYKKNQLIANAMDLIEYLESCTPCESYTALINITIKRLYSDYNNTHI